MVKQNKILKKIRDDFNFEEAKWVAVRNLMECDNQKEFSEVLFNISSSYLEQSRQAFSEILNGN